MYEPNADHFPTQLSRGNCSQSISVPALWCRCFIQASSAYLLFWLIDFLSARFEKVFHSIWSSKEFLNNNRWTKLVLFTYMDLFWPIWRYLNLLGLYGPIWAYLDLFETIWTNLDMFEPIWTYRDLSWPTRDKTCARAFTTCARAFVHGSLWNFILKLKLTR